ncbi:hypothetical protein EOS_05750 [Caballeronia mineralivorans PML1(12)]|uniref:DUF4747 domain-containing protein n=1 Tax=Caballeronia mineralivorans PML1(12) TaxID=908627 RepID=A0A0J1G4S8_9BURK|nr:hypothetical protein [Caballeronia mineralivorans]KLU27188.1 hypothetical protein EOS_05750 [Caballeronia mineralivorans PML1(12)]
MASIEYSLFRVKFVSGPQHSLFRPNVDRPALFLAAVNEKPSAELRKGYLWHIGNVEAFSNSSGYFAIGRTTRSTIEKFDETAGNFVYEELEESPFTHCVFDTELSLLAVAKKTSLASDAKGIAMKVQQLLQVSDSVLEYDVKVEILPIPDPEGFLRMLADAYRVIRFSATFHGPNPFDADEHFQKPLSVYLQAADGIAGKAQIQGDNLNREVLTEVTRSTAATGNEASARIIKARAERPVTINLKGDPIKRVYNEKNHLPQLVLQQFVELYRRVRSNGRNTRRDD